MSSSTLLRAFFGYAFHHLTKQHIYVLSAYTRRLEFVLLASVGWLQNKTLVLMIPRDLGEMGNLSAGRLEGSFACNIYGVWEVLAF